MSDLESKFGIKFDLPCFKVTISKDGDSATVVCPWDASHLFEQVVNALNFGNVVTIDVHTFKSSDYGNKGLF